MLWRTRHTKVIISSISSIRHGNRHVLSLVKNTRNCNVNDSDRQNIRYEGESLGNKISLNINKRVLLAVRSRMVVVKTTPRSSDNRFTIHRNRNNETFRNNATETTLRNRVRTMFAIHENLNDFLDLKLHVTSTRNIIVPLTLNPRRYRLRILIRDNRKSVVTMSLLQNTVKMNSNINNKRRPIYLINLNVNNRTGMRISSLLKNRASVRNRLPILRNRNSRTVTNFINIRRTTINIRLDHMRTIQRNDFNELKYNDTRNEDNFQTNNEKDDKEDPTTTNRSNNRRREDGKRKGGLFTIRGRGASGVRGLG